MSFSSCLLDVRKPSILDASVLINLRECSFGIEILKVFPNKAVVPRVVIEELSKGLERDSSRTAFLESVVGCNFVEIAELMETEYELFEKLMAGSDSVDDGEAATISVAVCRDGFPVIDEKRGRAVAVRQLGGVEPAWTLDILRHPSVVGALGMSKANEALYLALKNGRMRIDSQHTDAVVKAIGVERALQCTCLPNFRGLRENWERAISDRRR